MSNSVRSTQEPPKAATSPGSSNRSWVSELAPRFGLVGVWIIVIAVFALLRPDTFFTSQNLQTTLSTQAVPLMVALALTPGLAAGEYDLSVGGVMGLSLVLVGFLNVEQGWALLPAVLVALGAGVAVGFVNAFFIVAIGIESLVVTLGMGTLLAGVALGVQSLPVSGVSESLVNVSRTDFLGVQLVFYYALALVLVLWYVLSHTPLGRYIYFVGEGRNVARLSGIRVDAIRAGALIAGSTISAAAGIFQAGLIGGADPTIGPTLLLPAFAAAFLGATAIVPGRFNPWGTFIAVYFLATGIVGLQLIGLSGWIEQVFYGAALILAVAASRLASKRDRPAWLSRTAGIRPRTPATGENAA
jgi:ribose transport system permease protein